MGQTGSIEKPSNVDKLYEGYDRLKSMKIKVMNTKIKDKGNTRQGSTMYVSVNDNPLVLKFNVQKLKKELPYVDEFFIHLLRYPKGSQVVIALSRKGGISLTEGISEYLDRFETLLDVIIKHIGFKGQVAHVKEAAIERAKKEDLNPICIQSCSGYQMNKGKKEIDLTKNSGIKREYNTHKELVEVLSSIMLCAPDIKHFLGSLPKPGENTTESNTPKGADSKLRNAKEQTSSLKTGTHHRNDKMPTANSKFGETIGSRYVSVDDNLNDGEHVENLVKEIALLQKQVGLRREIETANEAKMKTFIERSVHEREVKMIKDLLQKEAEKVVTLQSEIEFKQKVYEDSLQRNKKLERKLEKLQTTDNSKTKTDSDSRLQGEIDKLQKQLAASESSQKSFKDTVKDYEEKLKKMSDKVSDSTSRLASEMNKKISENETDLENITIKCRPMTIAEDYNTFVSNPWLDAKQALDSKKTPEKDAVMFLCDILMISNKVAVTHFTQSMRTLAAFLSNPLKSDPKKKIEGNFGELPTDVRTIIGDQFRRTVANVDIKPLKENVITEVKIKYPKLKSHLTNKAMETYISEASFLTWSMVIQRPQMNFIQPDEGKLFLGEKIHPLAWGSKPKEKAVVRYYVYPTLMHGDTSMVMGKVFVA